MFKHDFITGMGMPFRVIGCKNVEVIFTGKIGEWPPVASPRQWSKSNVTLKPDNIVHENVN